LHPFDFTMGQSLILFASTIFEELMYQVKSWLIRGHNKLALAKGFISSESATELSIFISSWSSLTSRLIAFMELLPESLLSASFESLTLWLLQCQFYLLSTSLLLRILDDYITMALSWWKSLLNGFRENLERCLLFSERFLPMKEG
jgi:hypothetical protein